MEAAKYYKNIKILYEDDHILVCVKPSGVPVQTKSMGTADMVSILKSYLSQKQPKGIPYVGVIHRLDQPVEGILVFAKTSADAAKLNRQLTGSEFGKHYLAVVCGCPSSPDGVLSCYLKKDGRTNTSCVCSKNEPGAKHAELSYHMLQTTPDSSISPAKEETSPLSLLQITLKTGRHHQIRVQFADAGLPLWGDTKYNPEFTGRRGYFPVALCAFRLCFSHPQTKKAMEFKITPEGPGFAPFYRT